MASSKPRSFDKPRLFRVLDQRAEYLKHDLGTTVVKIGFSDMTLESRGGEGTVRPKGRYFNKGQKRYDLNRDDYDVLNIMVDNLKMLRIEDMHRDKPTKISITSHHPC